MFRDWMRNRLGLSANPKPAIEQWTPRPQPTAPMDFSPQIEQWSPHQQTTVATDFAPQIEPWVSKPIPTEQPAGGKRPGFALNPYMW